MHAPSGSISSLLYGFPIELSFTSHDEALGVGVYDVDEDGIGGVEAHEARHPLEQRLSRVQPYNVRRLQTVYNVLYR